MIECLIDALMDTIKLLPYFLVTFTLLEFLEHKISKNNQKILIKSQKYSPLMGGLLGAVPQCGFSSMAAELFSNKIITIGTLIAVFLSTSDEMIPIMLSKNINIITLINIVVFKVIIGIIFGFLIDIFYKKKLQKPDYKICHEDNCHCNEHLLISSIKHTLKIAVFVVLANSLINIIIWYLGEDSLANLLIRNNFLTYFASSIVGLIPNCASSIVITELYLNNLISIGHLLSGLLPASGLGILLLFKNNKNLKENITVLTIIYFIGVIIGILVDIII